LILSIQVFTMIYRFTRSSSNRKTGPIPVTITTRLSCAESCPYRGNGCYAESWPLRSHWDAVTAGRGNNVDIDGLCQEIRKLPHGQLWRHNQAGDLPGIGDSIDASALGRIVAANRGRKGFTYTHKPISDPANLAAVRMANDCGFVVNVSANSPREAAALKHQHPELPVVTVLPTDHTARRIDVDGVAVVTCPAALDDTDSITCANCGLCQLKDRPYVVGFPAHGTSKRKADAIARGEA
jgi:hypothetical protein